MILRILGVGGCYLLYLFVCYSFFWTNAERTAAATGMSAVLFAALGAAKPGFGGRRIGLGYRLIFDRFPAKYCQCPFRLCFKPQGCFGSRTLALLKLLARWNEIAVEEITQGQAVMGIGTVNPDGTIGWSRISKNIRMRRCERIRRCFSFRSKRMN